MRERRDEILDVRGSRSARYESWRGVFLGCAELRGFRGGRERLVSHSPFERAAATT